MSITLTFFSLYLILVLKIQFFFILTERVHEGRQLLSKFFNFLEAVAWRGPVVRTESECPRKLNSRFVVVSVSVAKIFIFLIFFHIIFGTISYQRENRL